MNNFARIKQMNIDELAEFLFVVQTDGCSHCSYYGGICNGKVLRHKIMRPRNKGVFEFGGRFNDKDAATQRSEQ